MTVAEVRSDPPKSSKPKTRIIDCDIHPKLASIEALLPYCEEPWRSHFAEVGLGMPGHCYQNPFGVTCRDAYLPDGRCIAEDPEAVIREHLDRYGLNVGVLIPGGTLGVSLMPNPDRAAAVARAENDYFLDTWLRPTDRFVGSIVVSTRDMDQAVREVERLGSEKKFVQVCLSSAQPFPLGARYFHPLYEVCCKYNLPVAIHPGTEGTGISGAPSPVGWPARYIEWHTNLATGYITHLISLIAEGVFEKFPDFKFILVEGGVSWIVPIMWRYDKNFKALRSQVPWLKKRPSEYLPGHVYMTTQPIEEPDNPEHLQTLLDMMDVDKLLLFSSDYPHWDFDAPDAALPRTLSDSTRKRILHENAEELFGL